MLVFGENDSRRLSIFSQTHILWNFDHTSRICNQINYRYIWFPKVIIILIMTAQVLSLNVFFPKKTHSLMPLSRSVATRAVALDISKAFDRVWHASFLHKLKSCGISGQIFGLMLEFLKVPEVALYFYKSTIRLCMEYCCHVWNGALSHYLELLDKLQKQICMTVGPSLAVSLEPLAYCRNVAILNLFYRYYFGRYSSELAQLVPLPYSQGWSTHYSEHGSIIRTGITIKKIRCYMHESACRWFIVKKAKYFEVMLNIFEFLHVWENVESWLVYAKSFLKLPIIFLNWYNKSKLVPVAFFCI